MKLLVIGDVHWSTYSSIVRGRGPYFSTRLEGLIASMQFVERIADEYGCDEEIFLGDFFDKPDLNADEISALSEIEWSTHPRIRHFVVGNHESGIATLEYNSTKALQFKNNVIEDTPLLYPLDEKTELLFLPYITEDNRKPLTDYLAGRNPNKKLIVFSHNDIKDFQMGMFLSKTGFSISEIEDNCDLYVNGHLHNGSWVTKKILNLGNLSGQNFSEDSLKYEHHICIIDTDTGDIKFIENPEAMNFYKLEINNAKDLKQLDYLKPHAVLSIKCVRSLEQQVRDIVATKDVVTYKVIIARELNEAIVENVKTFDCADHLSQFFKYIASLDDLEDLDIIKQELVEVCK